MLQILDYDYQTIAIGEL